jgi:hypothetical protein
MRSQIGMKVSIVSIPAEKEDTFGNECRLGRQSVDSSISMTTFNGLGRNHVQPFSATRPPRTCLFCRHDSKTQDIRDLASDGCQLPTSAQFTFAQNGRTCAIRKCFLRSPSASLTEDGREIARFKQADEAVWDILGLRPGSGRTLDDGAFGLLWLGQRASFAAPVPGVGASNL